MDGKQDAAAADYSPPFIPISGKVAVLLPASGSSLRFSTSAKSTPDSERENPVNSSVASWTKLKQYQPVGEHQVPLLVQTIKAFIHIPWISDVVLMVQEHLVESTKQLLEIHLKSILGSRQVTIKAGCETRHRTIQKGVQEISSWTEKPSVVIVHDVVRPFVDEATCRMVVEAALKYGAAGVFVPLVSTILRIDSDGMMSEALPRHELFASEMPQCFRLSVLKDAYRSALEEELTNGTECLALAKKYSECQVKMISVDPNLYFKVTYEKDLLTVNAILERDCK